MDLNIELRDMVLMNNYDFGETPDKKFADGTKPVPIQTNFSTPFLRRHGFVDWKNLPEPISSILLEKFLDH